MKNYFNVQGSSFVMVICIGYRTDYNAGIDEIMTMAVILNAKNEADTRLQLDQSACFSNGKFSNIDENLLTNYSDFIAH